MKLLARFSGVTLLSILLLCFCSNLYSQPDSIPENLYTKWITLALVGKNQAEIEYYFRHLDHSSLEQIKSRIRFTIIDSLKRSGIRNMIAKSADADDMNAVIRKVVMEIRYSGMELDQDLCTSIKEEFGISLENI